MLMAFVVTRSVSHHLSLMQDQVRTWRRRGVASANVNSLLTAAERRTILEAVLGGRIRLLYCAPERLGSSVRTLRRTGGSVALFAVDEAHCIGEWGNEFRPVYRRLGAYRYLLKTRPTLARPGPR